MAADDLVAFRLSDGLEILTGQLPSRLDGFGPARCEEHPIQIAGRIPGETDGQLDRAGVGVGPDREVGEAGRLRAGRIGQLDPAMADLGDEESGQAVQVLVALIIPYIAAVTPLDDAHSVDGVADAAEVPPEMTIGLGRKLAMLHVNGPPPIESLLIQHYFADTGN